MAYMAGLGAACGLAKDKLDTDTPRIQRLRDQLQRRLESEGWVLNGHPAERLPNTAIISVGHRPELEAFHERTVNLVRRKGGAKLLTGEVVAPPISIVSALVKRWRRAPPAASPATPTAANGEPDSERDAA